MTDLDMAMLDPVDDVAPRDPWLVRRDAAWGASEVPALLLAYDRREHEWGSARSYHREDAETGRTGFARIVARKAGVTARKSATKVMDTGSAREGELAAMWLARSELFVSCAEPFPRRAVPFVDRYCHALAVSPDRIAIDVFGREIFAELKCTWDSRDRERHWFFAAQVQAQLAAVPLDGGVIVIGPGWARDETEKCEPVEHEIERDDEAIARIRWACERAWKDVEELQRRNAK